MTSADDPLPVADEYPAVRIPASAFTWAGFREWAKSDESPEHGRYGFYDNAVYINTGSEWYGTHNAVKVALIHCLYGLVKDGQDGYYFGSGMLFSNEAAQLSIIPDQMYTSFDSLDSGRVSPDRVADGEMVGLIGSPDVTIEIVGPESVRKDTVDLVRLYHAAGVREYWLIDARGADIRFDLLRHAPDGYMPAVTPDGWRPSAAFAREFRLTRERNLLGDWSYTLHARPLSGS